MMTAAMEMPRVESAESIAPVVEAARGGDAAAFAKLYRRFSRSVHAVLLSRLAPEEAREAAQDVFMAVHRKLAGLQDPAAFGPWVHAIARNLAVSRLRGRAARPTEEPLRDHAAPAASESGLRERVLDLVRSLPESYQETLMMRLVEGLTGPEIAEATGLAPASVRVNLHRGMELLRPMLQKEGWR
jgi:RNA polymerase sigma-70 factor (ECF subfamily)